MNTDFEKLELLLRTKNFDGLNMYEKELLLKSLTEEEYNAMHDLYILAPSHAVDEIEPSSDLKSRLDNALKAQTRHTPLLRLPIPLYQTAAAAAILFFIGLSINLSTIIPTRVVGDSIRTVQYIDRPVKQIQYVMVPGKPKQKVLRQTEHLPAQAHATRDEDTQEYPVSSDNPVLIRQQEIAMANIRRVLNEKNGSSIDGDTVLKKMMVSSY
jgi:hypothetical protein